MALPSEFSNDHRGGSYGPPATERDRHDTQLGAVPTEGSWQFFAASQQLVRSFSLKSMLNWPEGKEWDLSAPFKAEDRSKVRMLLYAASEHVGIYQGIFDLDDGRRVAVHCHSLEDPLGIRVEGVCREVAPPATGRREMRITESNEVPPTRAAAMAEPQTVFSESAQAELERWKTAVSGGNLGVWDWDLRTNALYLSGYLPEMLGYEADHVPAVFELWTEHLHPADRRPTMVALRQHLAGGSKLYRMEHRLRHRDGSYRWALARGSAVRDDNGVPIRMVGVCTDITRRVETRLALEQSESRLRAVFEGSFDGILLLEVVRAKDGTIVDFIFNNANAQALQLIGRSREELIGNSLSKIFSGSEWSGQLDRFVQVFLRKERDLCELRMTNSDGQMGVFRQQVVPVESGVAIAISDITENRANEEALRASEKLVSEIAEAVPEFLYVYDFDTGWVSYRNRSLREALGYSDRTALDYPDPVIPELVHPEDVEVYRSFRPLKSSFPTEVEVRVRRADGEYEWIAIRESVFSWNEVDEPAQAIGSVSIITEKKRAEERMRDHVLELHRTRAKLKARQSELETHNDHLSNLARKDGLTDVYNHRAFQERLAEEVARCQRSGASLSLMIADIDDFKAFNDRYGHLAGDDRLRRFSSILQFSTRPCDFVARYGGEEFAIILPDANAHHAEVVGERILRVMGEEPEALRISASFGVAELNASTPNPLALVAAADSALYHAKKNGKRQVSVAPQAITVA